MIASCLFRGALLISGSCDCGDGDVWECTNPHLAFNGQNAHMPGRMCREGSCLGWSPELLTEEDWKLKRGEPDGNEGNS